MRSETCLALTRAQWQAEHQHFESGWWGDCCNTYGEETKQLRAYAPVMGLSWFPWRGGDQWPKYEVTGSVLDVGGGPVSMLLKVPDLARGSVVVDPCSYPDWTLQRYSEHGIEVQVAPAEDVLPHLEAGSFAEAWCYNVLQHVLDPELIVRQMRRVAQRIRIFEWVDQPAYLGHPHELKGDALAEWCGGEGTDVWFDEQYAQIGPESYSPVRQHAWGGVFE